MARFGMLMVVVAVGLCGMWLLILNGRRGAAPTAPGGAGRLVVVASVPALELAAKRVVGGAGETRVLLEGGADPVGYEVGEKGLAKFKGAGLLLVVGNELDGWALEAAKKAGRGDVPVLRVSDVMVYGVPPPGPGGATTRPSGHLTGKERTVDALGRAFVRLPEPYVAEKTPVIPGREFLWLDTAYAQLFIKELSVRLQELVPAAERSPIRDRAMLLGNTLISLHGAYEYRFSMLKNKRIRVTDQVLEPLAKRYGLELELIECHGQEKGGYTRGMPREKVDTTDKRPVFTVAAPGLDRAAFEKAIGVRVVWLDVMEDSTKVAEADFEVLCRRKLEEVYDGQVEAVGVR